MLCICVFFKKDAKTFEALEALETLKTNIYNFLTNYLVVSFIFCNFAVEKNITFHT